MIYLVKFLELAFVWALTGLILFSGISFIGHVSDRETSGGDGITIMATIICIVLSFFNLFYNNLMINLRFFVKMRCVTFGICLFDAVNCLFCYLCLVKPCKDKCFSPWTIVKWLIKAGIMGYTVYLIRDKKAYWEDKFQVGSLEILEQSNLDMYLIIYLLQHLIFMVARAPIFLIYSILTCCCEKGEMLPDEFKFEDRILSPDFVEYELGRLNNF